MRVEIGAALLTVALAVAPRAAVAATTPELAPLVVVGATPLPGATLDVATAPAPIQTATGAQIEASHAVDLSAFLNRSIGGVYVNEVQNNPLQPDVNFRGYTASPLLGAQQGLSVYMDGVRLNQPFGDVVSWDLIPRLAISSIALAPGSNPLFGLNTLGGALTIATKDGRTAPGVEAAASYGSYGRRLVEGQAGGLIAGNLYGYLAASGFGEDGWRAASPSHAAQIFGKLNWSGGGTDLALTGAYADSDLFGEGLQDVRLLARDYASIYTQPDQTRNRSALANLVATHRFSDTLSFSGNAYLRSVRTRSLNGDVNEGSQGESVYQPGAAEQLALTRAGYTGFPTAGETQANRPFPSWRCIAEALLNTEPNEKCDGLVNRTRTDQTEGGVSGQFTATAPLGALPNRLTAGAAWLGSSAHFIQSSQFGYLTPSRAVIGVGGPGAFADGTQNSENAFDARVDLTGRTRTASLYATDTVTLATGLNLTVSGRYDRSSVRDRDALTPGGGPGSLTSDQVYARLNPAVGLTYAVNGGLTAYAGYTQGSRAPSAIELGCADPANPCKLPNALAGDPPLKQVRADTIEAGLRGTASVFTWRLGLFRAQNHDDILFVADNAAGFGYFRNFGLTRRQGIEAGFDGRIGPVRIDASYEFLDATYRSAEIVPGAGNSANDGPAPGFDGNIRIRPGDRLPLTPRHIFKAGARWQALRGLDIDLDAIAVSSAYARGNENNADRPDGIYYVGRGESPGYVLFNLGFDYRLGGGVSLFGQADNLLDRRYYTAARLGATSLDAAGAVNVRPFAAPVIGGERPLVKVAFRAPGAPRMLRIGVRYRFGG